MVPRHERIGPLPGVDRPTVATYPAGAVLDERVLDVHELVWVMRGRALVRATGGIDGVTAAASPPQSVLLGPGDVLLLPPEVSHSFVWGPPEPSAIARAGGPDGCVHGYVHVEPGRIAPAARPVVAVRPGGQVPAELCRHLLRLGALEPAGWRGRVAATAQVLADLVVTAATPAAPRPPQPALVTALAAELQLRWGAGPPLGRVRIADLAASVHTSPSYLNRTVRAAYGRPLSTLLEQLRLTRVELLLTGTSSTLAAIARACGFADAYHCSRRFSLAYGMSPSVYRAARARPSLLDDLVVRRVADALWAGDPRSPHPPDQSMSKIEFPS